MGLIGIRYGKVVHFPCSPAWAQSGSVINASRPRARRIISAANHRFIVGWLSLSMRIRFSLLRRVITALMPERVMIELLNQDVSLYTLRGHSASVFVLDSHVF